MVKLYYLNLEPEGNNYEVHSDECRYIPSYEKREFLGVFYNCEEAVERAKGLHPNLKIDGCFFCSRDCHQF